MLRQITEECGGTQPDLHPPGTCTGCLRLVDPLRGCRAGAVFDRGACSRSACPPFPVDTRVYRLAGRLGLQQPGTASRPGRPPYSQEAFPPETYLDTHLDLIRHGREVSAPNPACQPCRLLDLCAFGQERGDMTAERLEAIRRALKRLQGVPIPSGPALPNRRWSIWKISPPSRRRAASARLLALYEVSRAIGSSLLLDDVLQQVMDSVIQLAGADRGFLLLLDEQSSERAVQVGAATKARPPAGRPGQPRGDQGMLQTSEGVTTNALADDRFRRGVGCRLRAALGAVCPAALARPMISVVYVDNRIRTALFDQRDREMLEAFAGQAAIAIENARMYTKPTVPWPCACRSLRRCNKSSTRHPAGHPARGRIDAGVGPARGAGRRRMDRRAIDSRVPMVVVPARASARRSIRLRRGWLRRSAMALRSIACRPPTAQASSW